LTPVIGQNSVHVQSGECSQLGSLSKTTICESTPWCLKSDSCLLVFDKLGSSFCLNYKWSSPSSPAYMSNAAEIQILGQDGSSPFRLTFHSNNGDGRSGWCVSNTDSRSWYWYQYPTYGSILLDDPLNLGAQNVWHTLCIDLGAGSGPTAPLLTLDGAVISLISKETSGALTFPIVNVCLYTPHFNPAFTSGCVPFSEFAFNLSSFQGCVEDLTQTCKNGIAKYLQIEGFPSTLSSPTTSLVPPPTTSTTHPPYPPCATDGQMGSVPCFPPSSTNPTMTSKSTTSAPCPPGNAGCPCLNGQCNSGSTCGEVSLICSSATSFACALVLSFF
jgi:hypothetical protein